MKLQFTSNKGTLSFKVNNDENEYMVTNILRETELNYRLAILVVNDSRSVELL